MGRRRVRWITEHGEDALRALRCAIAIPVAFAIGNEVVGGTQSPLFAAFGGFALLVFTDFPGDRTARAVSYVMLGLAGSALIAAGTVLATPRWLGVTAMFVVGTAVLFVGVLSAALAAAGRAALLTFILPVTIRADASVIPGRLTGWFVACAVCVPAALWLFPPTFHDRFRETMARTCAALADLLDARVSGAAAAGGDADAELEAIARRRLAELQTFFRGAANRPIGLTAGSRGLVRVIDELEWLTGLLADTSPAMVANGPPGTRETARAAVAVLRACAVVLGPARSEAGPEGRRSLARALDALSDVRRRSFAAVATSVLAGDPAGATPALRPMRPHEIAVDVELIGHAVSWSAAADARPVAQRLFGTGRPDLVAGIRPPREVPTLRQTTTGYVRLHSVWFRNSLRGGLGLAAAVAVADYFEVQHGFWVVLGVLSVLRSSALATGSQAVRAIIGTVIGFAVGVVIIEAVGTGPVALWIIFPIAVFGASFAPAAISFAAGQAAFTVVVLILLNLIHPVGWKVGLIRIEDVVLGCLVGLVVGLLLWPRGAAAAVGTALSIAYRTGATYFRCAVETVTRSRPIAPDDRAEVAAAARVLDDALRQFHVEVGGDRHGFAEMTTAAVGATRLRLAGDAVSSLRPEHPAPSGALPRSRAVLTTHTDRIVARADAPNRSSPPTTDGTASDIGSEIVPVLRGELDGTDVGDLPERLLWASLYVHALERRL